MKKKHPMYRRTLWCLVIEFHIVPADHFFNNFPRWCHDMDRFTHHWPIVRGIHRWPVDSPHKGPIMHSYDNIYTIVWFLRAPRWYIGPTAMPRAAVTPIAPERSEGAIGCDSRPRHCRRDDIPAWRPNKITLLALLPLDLTMYYHFISFLRAVQSRAGH